MNFREEVATAFRQIQSDICNGLEQADGHARFHSDEWKHVGGGGGISKVISHGHVFEKGGVNFSAVEGPLPTFMKDRLLQEATHFFATGVSIVIHPASPMVPIIHSNIRYFETNGGDAWFGGGIDLTPIYVDTDQASSFHRVLKNTCDTFHPEAYNSYKQHADDYFFIKHRNETRGIGGIFFDYLRQEDGRSIKDIFHFVQQVGQSFLPAYLPIVEMNKSKPFSEKQKQFQWIRRGRYVEFNLVYDRGTRFGLETGGRIESILMSLPEHASWIYNYTPEPGSDEEKTILQLKKGIDRI